MRRIYKVFILFVILFAPLVVFAHYWIADRNKLFTALFPVQALFSPVECSDNSPPWLEEFLSGLIPRMKTLSNQVVWIDRRHNIHHCESGWQDEFLGKRVSKNTRFRYGSLTKPLVSAAILELVQEAELSLTDHAINVLFSDRVDDEEVAKGVREIQIKDLLRHQSGLGGRFGAVFVPVERKKPWCPYRISRLLTAPLRFEPGSEWEYSNVNYCLLGEVYSQLVMMPFIEALDFKYSLSKRSMLFLGNFVEKDEVWRDYRYSDAFDGEFFKPDFHVEAISAAGGLSGSALDYATLIRELVDRNLPGFVSDADDVVPCDIYSPRKCYGNAFYVYGSDDGRVWNVKEGYYPGNSGIVVISEDKEIFVWLGNSDTENAREGSQQQWFLESLSKQLSKF